MGYGDISPHTPLGQLLSTFIMFLGFSIIAVPTGIITVELNELFKNKTTTKICENCFQGKDMTTMQSFVNTAVKKLCIRRINAMND